MKGSNRDAHEGTDTSDAGKWKRPCRSREDNKITYRKLTDPTNGTSLLRLQTAFKTTLCIGILEK